MFPVFGDSNSKSPTKNLLSKLPNSGTTTINNGMRMFLNSKVPKAIKLHNLN